MNKTPIQYWLSLIQSELTAVELSKELGDMYRHHQPYLAEMVVESFCPSKCQHCIYPPDYHRYNESLTEQQWQKAISDLYFKLGLKTFIFSGRSLTGKILRIAEYVKENLPDAVTGIIGDAQEVKPLLPDIYRLQPDWIDISIDGLAKEHDQMRGRQGAFSLALDVLKQLRDVSEIAKVNILSCLTAENNLSILDMVSFLNNEGFKNFFISPVVVYESVRPSTSLIPSAKDFVQFLRRLRETSANLSDSYLEVNIYDVGYFRDIKRYQHDLYELFQPGLSSLNFEEHSGDNEVHISYSPTSVAGSEELIINSNGDIIPPRIVAEGRIDKRLVAGNITKVLDKPYYLRELVKDDVLGFYLAELLKEREQLDF